MALKDWLPARLCTTDNNSVSLAVQLIFHPAFHPLVQPVSHQFGDKESISKVDKTIVKVDKSTYCLPHVLSACHLITESNAVGQAQSAHACCLDKKWRFKKKIPRSGSLQGLN